MAKSTYCDRYAHQLCAKHGHAGTCDCACHAQVEQALEESIVPQPEPSPELTAHIAVDAAEQADAEVMRFAESLKMGKQKAVPSTPPEGSLDAAAQRLLDVLYTISPDWQERDAMLRDEWALSPAQRMLKYAGLVLEQQLHLNVLQGYEFIEPTAQPSGAPQQPEQLVSPMRAECPQCHQEFDRKIPGQVTCSNECGDLHFPKPTRKGTEFADEFNRFIESQLNNKTPASDDVRAVAVPVDGVLR